MSETETRKVEVKIGGSRFGGYEDTDGETGEEDEVYGEWTEME